MEVGINTWVFIREQLTSSGEMWSWPVMFADLDMEDEQQRTDRMAPASRTCAELARAWNCSESRAQRVRASWRAQRARCGARHG